jgi:hypothetical protein
MLDARRSFYPLGHDFLFKAAGARRIDLWHEPRRTGIPRLQRR